MRPVRSAFPLPVWLAAFFLLLAAFLAGLWLLSYEAVPAVSLTDISLIFRAGSFNSLLPGIETALYATLLAFALGYPAGCILALWRRRTIFVLFAMPFIFIAGTALLYGGRLIHMLPQGFISSLITKASGYAAYYQSIAVILLPLMILYACSIAKALDPALARAARCLGASRSRAFLTLIFPRILKGVPAGLVTVFLPALGLSHLSNQMPGTAAETAIPISFALLLLTAIVIAIILLILRKARSVSPC